MGCYSKTNSWCYDKDRQTRSVIFAVREIIQLTLAPEAVTEKTGTSPRVCTFVCE